MVQLCHSKLAWSCFLHLSFSVSYHYLKTPKSQIPTFSSLNTIHLLRYETPFYNLSLCRMSLCFWLYRMSISLKILHRHWPHIIPWSTPSFILPQGLNTCYNLSLVAISHVFFKFGSFSSFKPSFNVTCLETTFLTILSMYFPPCYSLTLHYVYFFK